MPVKVRQDPTLDAAFPASLGTRLDRVCQELLAFPPDRSPEAGGAPLDGRMFEQVRAGQGQPLSWKWGVLGFAALPYASVAAADIVAILVRLVGMVFGHEAPYEVLARIERLGALPTLPLVDASLAVYLRTGSWALAGVAYYALLLGAAAVATAAVRWIQSRRKIAAGG